MTILRVANVALKFLKDEEEELSDELDQIGVTPKKRGHAQGTVRAVEDLYNALKVE